MGDSNFIFKKIKMYVMITSIESDFIETYEKKLCYEDIPQYIIERSHINDSSKENYENILRSLNLQDFIEIACNNIIKLEISEKEKRFLNKEFSKIIPIRNRVMHPRLLDFYDYVMLEQCFSMINDQIEFVNWIHVTNAKQNILNNDIKLLEYQYLIRKKSENVIENIPSDTDFEETSFIGRKTEIGQLKQLLFKSNVNILSIVGDGGIGKTAITIKLLYDLLDEAEPKFEIILWTSLKTNELNKYEFKRIDNAIKSISDMYESINAFIGKNQNITPEQNIINIAKSFKTLLVLDNLETINSEEIKDFLSTFTEYGKVIITSRIGLGEMEKRFPLQGMNKDDLKEYTNTLLELYGLSNRFSDEEITRISIEVLHSNPLSIKWFLRSIYNGKTVEDVLNHKDDLVNFCLSNVYEKLSEDAKNLIKILNVINQDVSYAELFYLIQGNNEDDTKIRKAINDLISCNFLNQITFKKDLILSITSFAKEFLTLLGVQETIDLQEIHQKQKKLMTFEQDMLIKYNENKYSIGYFKFNHGEKRKIVASLYLKESLDLFHKKDLDNAKLLLRIAKKLANNYFECYKIEALYSAKVNPKLAIEQFYIAIANCDSNEDLAVIYVHFATHLLKENDYQQALEKIIEAEKLSNDYYITLEKVKILACMGNFTESMKIVDDILCKDLNDFLFNLTLTRKADILRRKHEREDNIENKVSLLLKALDILKKSKNPDNQLLNFVGLILHDLAYFYFDNEIINAIVTYVEYFNGKLFKTTNYKKFAKRIRENINNIKESKYKIKLLNYVIDYKEIIETLSPNQAIVYSMKDGYGFIKNKEYYQGIYFNFKNINFKCQFADIVKIGEVFSTNKGYIVYDMELEKRLISGNSVL